MCNGKTLIIVRSFRESILLNNIYKSNKDFTQRTDNIVIEKAISKNFNIGTEDLNSCEYCSIFNLRTKLHVIEMER